VNKVAREERCRTYWGSHGCQKRVGHLGRHVCRNGCPRPALDAPIIQRDPDGAVWVRVEQS
jgi:hypothetical protein